MPSHWWKKLVLAAGIVAVVFACGLAAFGLSTPEPVASAALGPDWQCSRLIFFFTTCNRIKHTQSTAVRIAKIPVCGRLRT